LIESTIQLFLSFVFVSSFFFPTKLLSLALQWLVVVLQKVTLAKIGTLLV
jgi:hypothetical protein